MLKLGHYGPFDKAKKKPHMCHLECDGVEQQDGSSGDGG